jgi:hypothetical protein
MPNKDNEDRRHHIAKKSMKVTNGSEYNAGLRRHGSLTLWITEEAVAAWRAPARLTRGGQAQYSDTAIETNLLLRSAFRLPLRQSQGLMTSVFELLEVGLAVPDYSTVCRRGTKLPSISLGRLPKGPLHVLIDSTGLKVYGAGQWLVKKHGQRSRRCWRKLHLAVDANTNLIVACVLTEQDEDDPSQVGPLLAQIPSEIEIAQVTADGAYDGEPTYQTILARQSDIAMVIPPRIGAVLSQADGAIVTHRDAHVLMMEALGRLGWQEATGYGKRSLVETTMGRYKGIIGARLRSRSWPAQQCEAAIGVAVLNRMTEAGCPRSVRTGGAYA